MTFRHTPAALLALAALVNSASAHAQEPSQEAAAAAPAPAPDAVIAPAAEPAPAPEAAPVPEAAPAALAAPAATAPALQFPTVAREGYAAILGQAVIPDGARDGRDAYGVQMLYGFPVTQIADLEFHGGTNMLRRESDQRYDVFYHLGLALKLNLPRQGDFSPFLIGGFGATREDEVNEQQTRPFADLGLGFTYPIAASNVAVRAESRYHLVYVEDRGNDNTFGDVRFNLGLQFGFDQRGPRLRDSDNDGVIDGRDRCANTAAGVEVDGQGCPVDAIDRDGDGVPDRNDQCPGTPPGSAVDAIGCPPAPAPVEPPAPVPLVIIDADGDGVLDGSDACPATPKGLKVDVSGCLVAQTTVLQDVQFETNSSKLTGEAQEILKGVAGSLKTQPDLRLEVSGHTDALGPQSYNLALSLNRAKSVEKFLLEQGVEPIRLRAEGYGEFIPVASNDTEAGRATNRRVEFKVMTPTPAGSP